MSKQRRWKDINKKVLCMLYSSIEEESNSSFISNTFSDLSSNDELDNSELIRNSSEAVPNNSNFSEASLGTNSTSSESEYLSCQSDPESDSPYLSEVSPLTSSDDEGIQDDVSLSQKLAKCAIENGWSRRSVNKLLKILREEDLDLPKDARTILRTPREVPILKKCGGDYIYFGIEKGMLRLLDDEKQFLADTLRLKINVDGLPLYKSSGLQVWPILANFNNSDIFITSIFCGKSKPLSLQDFLQDFITELTHIIENGINFNGKNFKVEVHSFLCDAPARSFLKRITGHNGYSGCERCIAPGDSINKRLVYHDSEDYAKRTNEIFQNFGYEHHQVVESVLTEVGFDMIKQFALDYMHLVCLGTVWRLLNYLKKGPVGKLSAGQIDQISSLLLSLSGSMPSEFCRQPRSLKELDRWKATEFRQFLLYTGPVVLREVVSEDVYNHFMALNVSMSILLQSDDEIRQQYLDYSEDLLKQFVSNSKFIYGLTFSVYNIHHLIHLPDDCRYFGCSLNEISCFEFENFLQRIKQSVRGSTNPIVQIAKRQYEFEEVFSNLNYKATLHKVSASKKDYCFLSKNSKSIWFVKECLQNEMFRCEVVKVKYLSDLYAVPIPSSLLDVYLFEKRHRRYVRVKDVPRGDLHRKCV